ncbi:MAG TPA: WecB/TagA/CpsF family glycosyltransferase [Alloacidobacterium sp.]|nr:WecB/TagA/CpsF family glycosyltransferase [Alloacidobacterium sp.]
MTTTFIQAGRHSRAAFIDGLPISEGAPDQVLAEIDRAIAAGEQGRYISITNTESMYHGLRKPDHGRYIRNADFSLCDGVGVIIAGWAWGHKIKRYNGPILQLDCSQYGEARGWRHFFYGGKEGVADEMARRLKEKYPGLIVCGTFTPPFRQLTAEEDAAVVAQINAAKPDIVWVGLGLIKQEKWIAEHLGRVTAPWMVGVGAAFDYHAGAVSWAPAPIRALGLEWLFRLIIQPRLRAKRYWWSGVYVVQAFLKGVFTLAFLRPQRSLEGNEQGLPDCNQPGGKGTI